MSLRHVSICRAGNRDNLFMGGDREMVMFTGLISGVLIFIVHSWFAAGFGVFLWVSGLYLFRLMAKSDPQLRHVYLKQRKYTSYYPAQSTPYHDDSFFK